MRPRFIFGDWSISLNSDWIPRDGICLDLRLYGWFILLLKSCCPCGGMLRLRKVGELLLFEEVKWGLEGVFKEWNIFGNLKRKIEIVERTRMMGLRREELVEGGVSL